MKKILVLIILIILIIVLGCEYSDPFASYKGKNLISKLDLTTDWNIEKGIIVEATDDIPPTGISQSYYLFFENLIEKKSSDFETSSGINDAGLWVASPDNEPNSSPPTTFQIISTPSGQLEGTKSLYIKLDNNPAPKFIYYEFTPEASLNYTFKFNYYNISGNNILLSYGLSSDNLDIERGNFQSAALEIDTINFSFAVMTSSLSQIRFGFKENSDWNVVDMYIDKIALYPTNNHSVSKLLSIFGSNDQTDDGTGEKFYEGIYGLTIYAKSDTSDKLTLKIGSAAKTYSLTTNWVKYQLQAQILRTDGFLKLEIMPTVVEEANIFPGGIYITNPALYFYPDKSVPD